MDTNKTSSTTEKEIDKIVAKVRYVEFLHGVPVELPSETKELLRSGIRQALSLARSEARRELLAEIAEVLPEERAKCLCHKNDGYAVCCDECKESLFCGFNLAITTIKSKIACLVPRG